MACPTGKLKVESKDPRINYNLLPGEKLMTCPYNESHAVLPIKFAKHVMNCHRLHLNQQKEKKEGSLFSICQYDRSHHVRNEDLADHESTCEAKNFESGWGDDDIGSSAMSSEAAAGTSGKPIEVVLQKPPPIDDEAMKALQPDEEWGEDPSGAVFNPDKRIHELRMKGYAVIKGYEVVGLSKSEKKEFYERERQAMQNYEKVKFLDRMKQSGGGLAGSSSAASFTTADSSCASIYGYDDVEELEESD